MRSRILPPILPSPIKPSFIAHLLVVGSGSAATPSATLGLSAACVLRPLPVPGPGPAAGIRRSAGPAGGRSGSAPRASRRPARPGEHRRLEWLGEGQAGARVCSAPSPPSRNAGRKAISTPVPDARFTALGRLSVLARPLASMATALSPNRSCTGRVLPATSATRLTAQREVGGLDDGLGLRSWWGRSWRPWDIAVERREVLCRWPASNPTRPPPPAACPRATATEPPGPEPAPSRRGCAPG